jgi:hypothetical protein
VDIAKAGVVDIRCLGPDRNLPLQGLPASPGKLRL